MKRAASGRVFFQLLDTGEARWLCPGSSVQQGALTALARCEAREWIWLLPGQDVQVAEVEVPAARPAVQLQALPYVLEDQLLGALDELAIAHRRRDRTRFIVALTRRETLLEGHAALGRAGVRPTACVAESSAVPCRTDEWTLASIGEQAWLCCAARGSFAFPSAEWPAFLETSLVAGPLPARLRVFGNLPDAERLPRLIADTPLVHEPAPHEPLALFAAGYVPGSAPDFVTQLPGATVGLGLRERRWLQAAAGVVLATAVGHAGFLWWQVSALERAVMAARAATEQSFREIFPAVPRLVDARVQASQALAELAARAGGGGAFPRLLAVAGAPLVAPDAQGLSLVSLGYEREALEVRIAAPDMPAIERYQRQLRDGPVPVATLSVERRSDGAEATLRLGQAP